MGGNYRGHSHKNVTQKCYTQQTSMKHDLLPTEKNQFCAQEYTDSTTWKYNITSFLWEVIIDHQPANSHMKAWHKHKIQISAFYIIYITFTHFFFT